MLVLGLGVVLRARCFHPYAADWDPCEYVWAIEGGYLPHSPYILYLWIGKLLATALPADIALSAVSLASGAAALALIAGLELRHGGGMISALVAGAAYAVFPCAVWFSGIQEVYSLAVALALGGVLAAASRGSSSPWIAGLLFGCALASHSGIVFLAPAFVLVLAGGAVGGGGLSRLRRVALAGAASLVAPAAAVAWVAAVLPPSSGGGQPLWDYVAGIAPVDTFLPGGYLDSLRRTLAGALEPTLGGPPGPALLLASSALLAAVRFPRAALFWVVWAAPYVLYETAIGWNVDTGVHVVFAGPAIAGLLGCGATAAVQAVGVKERARSAAAVVLVGAVVVALGPSAARSFRLAQSVQSRAAFLSSEPAATLVAARTTTRPDAVLVQPPWIDNVNAIPVYARRRPIILHEGRFLLFEGVRGSPLNLTSFSPVTPQILERLLQQGTPVVALGPDPLLAAPDGLRWGREGAHYVLEPASDSR